MATFQIVNAFIVGIFLSYIVLLSVALIELNILSITLNINKNALGVVSNIDTITSTLKKSSLPPQIVASDDAQNKALVAIASTIAGTDNFYGHYILSSIPGFLVFPVKFNSSVLLVDNNLIITQLNAKDLGKISPTLSYLLVQRYFSDRRIKFYPKISIMSQKEYQAFRTESIVKGIKEVDQAIKDLEKQKKSTTLSIEQNKNQLLTLQNKVSTSNAQKESTYKHCLSDGSYTLAYCKNLLNSWEDLTPQNLQINNLATKISSDESKLKEYDEYNTFYTTLEKSVKARSVNIPQELGLFTPKDSIKIVFSTTNSHKVADYLVTLVHEYNHYASYISEQKKLSDLFFEEGLTEYFARQTIKDDLHFDTNVGYPIFVKIIDQMTKRILESDLEEIYITKDQARLEKTLDDVYGENFYKDNRLLFLTLQYTSNTKQALAIANKIMQKMGGSPIKLSDFLPSH
jgi:hypothetical protein